MPQIKTTTPMVLCCHDVQFTYNKHTHTDYTQAHTQTHTPSLTQQGSPTVLAQYSQKVALSRESALALRPPAWSPLRYFPPSARMATLLRSQNWKRNCTGVELLHTTAVSSPTHQYFPWESAQTHQRTWRHFNGQDCFVTELSLMS